MNTERPHDSWERQNPHARFNKVARGPRFTVALAVLALLAAGARPVCGR
jgi:hypothetical protein